ncbi:putative uncharacterized protein DDB_G0287457 [Daktulosphaira vitifoliae]|uniref:putative uncharacterized protein DDB_G0287457 n=1 Tax=Daktulosphaira vitifoliae TaxID=58002 RepID=UPI0021AA3D96|nr:putative uncharacterized protein DDB_G0287457 [Daktulosphaira vitifoliae]
MPNMNNRKYDEDESLASNSQTNNISSEHNSNDPKTDHSNGKRKVINDDETTTLNSPPKKLATGKCTIDTSAGQSSSKRKISDDYNEYQRAKKNPCWDHQSNVNSTTFSSVLSNSQEDYCQVEENGYINISGQNPIILDTISLVNNEEIFHDEIIYNRINMNSEENSTSSFTEEKCHESESNMLEIYCGGQVEENDHVVSERIPVVMPSFSLGDDNEHTYEAFHKISNTNSEEFSSSLLTEENGYDSSDLYDKQEYQIDDHIYLERNSSIDVTHQQLPVILNTLDEHDNVENIDDSFSEEDDIMSYQMDFDDVVEDDDYVENDHEYFDSGYES